MVIFKKNSGRSLPKKYLLAQYTATQTKQSKQVTRNGLQHRHNMETIVYGFCLWPNIVLWFADFCVKKKNLEASSTRHFPSRRKKKKREQKRRRENAY